MVIGNAWTVLVFLHVKVVDFFLPDGVGAGRKNAL